MRIDWSSTAASAAVAVTVSLALWWWQGHRLRLKSSSTTITAETPTTKNKNDKKDHVPNRSVTEEQQYGASQASAVHQLQEEEVVEPMDGRQGTSATNSTCRPVAPPTHKLPPEHATAVVGLDSSSHEQERNEPDAKEFEKNFRIKDIPDFTIELNDSDNDMF